MHCRRRKRAAGSTQAEASASERAHAACCSAPVSLAALHLPRDLQAAPPTHAWPVPFREVAASTVALSSASPTELGSGLWPAGSFGLLPAASSGPTELGCADFAALSAATSAAASGSKAYGAGTAGLSASGAWSVALPAGGAELPHQQPAVHEGVTGAMPWSVPLPATGAGHPQQQGQELQSSLEQTLALMGMQPAPANSTGPSAAHAAQASPAVGPPHAQLSMAGDAAQAQLSIAAGASGAQPQQHSYEGSNFVTRLSVKVFNCTPQQLPEGLRGMLTGWLNSTPAAAECYIRPGCVHLTMQASTPEAELPAMAPHRTCCIHCLRPAQLQETCTPAAQICCPSVGHLCVS